MKKTLVVAAMLVAFCKMDAQIVWLDDFNDKSISDWTTYDLDGDGWNWGTLQLTGTNGAPVGTPFLTSISRLVQPMTPDNLAVSPQIDLTNVPAGKPVTLTWYVFASDPNRHDDNYDVYVGTSKEAGELTATESLFNESDIPLTLEERTVDISQFAGQKVYVGFRHHNTSGNGFRLGIDDVSIKVGGETEDDYCTINIPAGGVQPITKVNFAGIDHSSDATVGGSDGQEYFLDVEGTVKAGTTSDITVEGNTDGDNTSSFTVFIDWNQNGILGDAGEKYVIGSITNSTGTDGKQATASIAVPDLAKEGKTRMRIVKNSDSVAPSAPCGDYDFGQAEDYTLNVLKGDGCLVADNGGDLGLIYFPDCYGAPELITDQALTGEYSKVEVTKGIEYIFSTSDSSIYITIGNNSGTKVLAFGEGSVTWTADITGEIRFYSHLDAACGYIPRNDLPPVHSRFVQCGEPRIEPDYGCDQEYTGPFSVASSISGDKGFSVANDFFVPKQSEQYKINSVTLLLIPTTKSDSDFKSFDLSILNDNNGPGSVLKTFTDLTPTNIELYPETFNDGYPTYMVTFDLGGYELPVDAEKEMRYWLQATGYTISGPSTNIFWAGYTRVPGWKTAPNYQSANGGSTWSQVIEQTQQDKTYDSIWSIDGDCTVLGTSNTKTSGINYYPNPVNDVLNISADQKITSVSIYNVAGQKVINNVKADNGQINVSRLTSGTYIVTAILENGKTETFKVIKK